MTFGEKLKQARKKVGLSQEELAGTVNVSRSAIAKWETDKGMPDVSNLKVIAQVLNTSIDYLLEDGKMLDLSVIREPIDLSVYGKGRKNVLKNKAIREKYPNAEIFPLIAEQKLTKGEKLVDTAIWLLTPLIDAIKFSKGLNNLDNAFYLVNQGERQYLVTITSEFIERRILATSVYENKFEMGGCKFVKCKYQVKTY